MFRSQLCEDLFLRPKEHWFTTNERGEEVMMLGGDGCAVSKSCTTCPYEGQKCVYGNPKASIQSAIRTLKKGGKLL
jgi:hypothetical protein